MRICLIARGNYALVRVRAEMFSKLGHDVHVVSLHGGESDGFEVHRIDPVPRLGPLVRYPAAVPLVWRTVRRLDPDVIDVHGLSAYGLFALLPHRCPVVATAYGPDIYFHAAKYPPLRLVARLAAQKADVVFGSTPVIGDYAESILGLNIRHKLETRSWGIPTAAVFARASERRSQIRAELGVGEQTRVILHSRHIVQLWRVANVLEAFRSVVAEHPNTELWYAYPPPTRDGARLLEDLRRRCVEAGIADKVRFLGPQSYERIISLMHAADVYVCVGEADLLASSVLESMATGLIPVLVNLPAYREVIESGRNGYLLPDAEPTTIAYRVKATLTDFATIHPELEEENIKLMRERYDVEACASWMVGLYQRLIDQRARAGRLADST